MTPDFVQLLALLQQFFAALMSRPESEFTTLRILKNALKTLIFILWYASSHLLDDLFGFGLEENDNGIELSIVQAIHRVRRYVQQRVLPPVHNLSNGTQANDAGPFGAFAATLFHLVFRLWKQNTFDFN